MLLERCVIPFTFFCIVGAIGGSIDWTAVTAEYP